MSFILTYIIVCILPPKQVNIGCSIPILTRQRNTRTTMCFQQSRIDEVIGINNALCQSTCHLTIIYGIDDLLWIILTFLSSVSTDIINKTNIWKFSMNLVKDTICNSTTGFAKHDVLLTNTTITYHRTHQSQSNERRRVEFYRVVVSNGIVQIEFYGYHLTFLISTIASPMRLIEIFEKRFPCFLCRRFTC